MAVTMKAPVAEVRIFAANGTALDVIVDTENAAIDALAFVAGQVQDGGLIHFKVPHVGFINGAQVVRVQFIQAVHPR